MKINEIIVVEGRDDVRAVKAAVDAECLTTSGLGLNEEILKTIKTAAERKGVIILTDPDYPGDKIRRLIKEALPHAKEAFIKREDASNPKTGKFGIEFASAQAIREALQNARASQDAEEAEFTREDMQALGLSGQAKSAELRKYLTDHFAIGHANSKQFLKKINAFAISREELEEKINDWKRNQEDRGSSEKA